MQTNTQAAPNMQTIMAGLVAALEQLENGALNVAENAKLRGDLYDEGYAKAMAECANAAIALAVAADPFAGIDCAGVDMMPLEGDVS